MANICESNVKMIATKSEWNEIAAAFGADRIDWPPTYDGDVDFSTYDLSFSFANKWVPSPLIEGQMYTLSSHYPAVVFRYTSNVYEDDFGPATTWLCDGADGDSMAPKLLRERAYEREARRFLEATPIAAEGRLHRVELMPDGRVAADGENRFGECDIYDWAGIEQIACGDWHTVGLKADGTLVACGSNANGQCEVGTIHGAAAIACGRYHTAVLLNTGKVKVLGRVEQRTLMPNQTKNPDPNTQTPVAHWPAIAQMCCIFDAVIGLDEDGELYIDGYCPCSDEDTLLAALSIR